MWKTANIYWSVKIFCSEILNLLLNGLVSTSLGHRIDFLCINYKNNNNRQTNWFCSRLIARQLKGWTASVSLIRVKNFTIVTCFLESFENKRWIWFYHMPLNAFQLNVSVMNIFMCNISLQRTDTFDLVDFILYFFFFINMR